MSIFDAIIYGIIQGLSEFLPVSSSGHLALLPYFLKVKDPGVVFDLMMHFGTALAVSIYFWTDIKGYLKTLGPDLLRFDRGGENHWFVRNFTFATFVSVILIVLLMPVAKLARDPWVIIFNLSTFGIILWIADYLNRKRSAFLDQAMTSGMCFKVAGLIGAAQALAIFPGVSRSGITLTVALLLGMRRKEAGAFSFLLSLPIIFAGILKEVPELLKSQDQAGAIVQLTGVISSFVVGWLTIHFFMKLISKIHLGIFTVYRVLIALLVYIVVL